MSAAEIVIGEVKSKSGLKVFPLFRERVRQSGQPLDPLPHRSILSFDMRRANPVIVGIADDWPSYGVYYLGEAVATFWAPSGRFPDFLHSTAQFLHVISALLSSGVQAKMTCGSSENPTFGASPRLDPIGSSSCQWGLFQSGGGKGIRTLGRWEKHRIWCVRPLHSTSLPPRHREQKASSSSSATRGCWPFVLCIILLYYVILHGRCQVYKCNIAYSAIRLYNGFVEIL